MPKTRLWFAAVFGLACAGGDTDDRPNVILISLDTLRADRLGMYGYDRPTSPAMDSFAERGVVFDTVVAESPWTLPSHVTMLSGLSPDRHGTGLPSLRPGDDVRYLSQDLLAEGYYTVALTDGGYMGRRYGFDRGFAVFEDDPDGLRPALARAHEEIAASGDAPFLLFLHTYDIHCPYEPAPETLAMFESPGAVAFDLAGKCGNPHLNQMVFRRGNLAHLNDAYDAGIREVDDLLGSFFATLDSTGVLDDTIVIITSDHGEEFQEHGRIGHERSLYREVLMIPLVIVAPGLAPARAATPVSLADIVPTVHAMIGLDRDTPHDGRSLVDAAGDAWTLWAAADRTMTSVLDWKLPLRSVMSTTHHRIRNRRLDRDELYDVVADPGETNDLVDESPDPAPDLAGALDRRLDGGAPIPPSTLDEVTPEQAERLRSLGYIR